MVCKKRKKKNETKQILVALAQRVGQETYPLSALAAAGRTVPESAIRLARPPVIQTDRRTGLSSLPLPLLRARPVLCCPRGPAAVYSY